MTTQIERSCYGNYMGYVIQTIKQSGAYTLEIMDPEDGVIFTRMYDFPTFFDAVKAGKEEIAGMWIAPRHRPARLVERNDY